jgi:hypothetical protein
MYKFEVVYSAHHGFVCGLSFLSRSEIPYSFFCSCAFYFGLEREREREREGRKVLKAVPDTREFTSFRKQQHVL